MAQSRVAPLLPINSVPAGFDLAKGLPKGLMEFYLPLHRQFAARRNALAEAREKGLLQAAKGQLPQHLPPSAATKGEWKIKLPEWCQDQRNQMTGPADDGELVVKMLNSGAPGVMLDVEDSMANAWEHLLHGIENIVKALYGELTYHDRKRETQVGIKPSKTVIFSRVRGLHLGQYGLIKGEVTPASLFDLALIAYQVDAKRLKHPLAVYIPKSESPDEAIWFAEVLKAVAKAKGWEPNYIKCMALVEAHPLAYQMEEFLYNLRDHIIGLNLGRWDYMASLIHFNLHDPDWVLPDRNTIPHNVAFFQNLRVLIPKICHNRGILAIGGMTALYPSRTDAELNARALKVLAEDKKNEANCFMDGAWTGHPDQNEIAVAQFPVPNQLKELALQVERYPNLRPNPRSVGKTTVTGTRAAVRTAIRYRFGVLQGRGASLLDGYMEDLATDRIYRLMIAQRMQHYKKTPIVDESGKIVEHTPAFIPRLFDEELERILRELPAETPADVKQSYREARRITETLISTGEINPV